MIKAFIFDFYGVICNEIGTKWYSTQPETSLIPELKIKYDTPSDYGKISEYSFFNGIAVSVGKTGQDVRKEWLDSVIINFEIITLIKMLKSKNYKIAVCSNTVSELFREIMEMNNISNLFDVTVVSSEIGKVKPYSEIYEYTLSELGLKPSEAIFIDDRTINCEGAQNVGIKSYMFDTINRLYEDIRGHL
jgi:putative hydrolase of the HAD superfamily